MKRTFIIPSKKEYNIDNNKLVDNRIRTVDYDENVDTTTLQRVTGSYDYDDEGKMALECSVDCYIPDTVTVTNSGGLLRRYFPCYFIIENATSWDMFFSVVQPQYDNQKYVKLANEVISYENFKELVEEHYETTTTFEGSWVCAYGIENGNRIIYFTIVTLYSGITAPYLTSFECKYRQITTQTKTNVYSIEGENVSEYSLDTNEFIASNTKGLSGTIGETLCKKITNEYKDGKETVTIKCSVGDFYTDEYADEKAINIDKAETVDVGDIAIPYMRTGQKGGYQYDTPLSKYADGSAKEFRVVGVEHSFDGAIWQTITLVEEV